MIDPGPLVDFMVVVDLEQGKNFLAVALSTGALAAAASSSLPIGLSLQQNKFF
jgi:hypothetical protein